MELSFERVVRRFAAPQSTAHGVLEERESIEVTLVDFDGAFGRGEAAPLESFDGVSIERALEALEAHRVVLGGVDAAGARDACAAADPLPQALAAIDVALWDLAGRRAGRPIAALLALDPADAVEVNASVADLAIAAAASAAAAAVAAGYRTIKLKVGTGSSTSSSAPAAFSTRSASARVQAPLASRRSATAGPIAARTARMRARSSPVPTFNLIVR